MARITLDDIKTQLAETKWKLLSDEYLNLDSPLFFECPEGHQVEAPWKKMRVKQECPICSQNIYKVTDTKIIPKRGKIRILALDQASYDCGWSVFDDNKLIKYGIESLSKDDEAVRINKLKHWLISMVSNWQPDYIAIEGIQYQEESDGKAKMGITVFQTLAHLQGVLIDTCYELKIPSEICPTNTWRAHCGVKGKHRTDKKKSAQLLVKKWYDISVSNDEADAIGIGRYLSNKLTKTSLVENWE